MLTLFHQPLFANCRFVRICFAEYGEELALIEERPWTRRKEFLALNAAGTLPVLLAEGDVPVVGAAVLIVLESVLASWTEHWQFVLGPILVLIVLFGRGHISALASRFGGTRP